MFSRTLLELEFHFNNWDHPCSSILYRCDKFVTLRNLRKPHRRSRQRKESRVVTTKSSAPCLRVATGGDAEWYQLE